MDSIATGGGSSASYEIYTGVWTDWSDGKVFGSVLTTTRPYGSLLIAFLSLFVTVVGTSFWRIGCFILHYIYSAEVSRDGIYHQRQAVLRNAANALSGLASLYQIFFAWRQSQPGKTRSRRILPLAIFTVLTLAAFAVASTFSSRISTIAGNEVLISSKNCGFPDMAAHLNMSDISHVFMPYRSKWAASVANYAQQCYLDYPNTEGCRTLIRKKLHATVTKDAACPFPGDICKSGDSNIMLDSGYIDVHRDLGINTPEDRRFQIRQVMQCAPLKTEGYKEELSSLRPDFHDPYMRYYYGETATFGVHKANFTYQHMIPQLRQYIWENGTGPVPDFDLRALRAEYMNGTIYNEASNFIPIEELKRTDADLFLIFLSANNVLFSQQSDDLWYPAHTIASKMSTAQAPDDWTPVYQSDEPASPLACTLQYQYCKAGLRCTQPSSFLDTWATSETLQQTDAEKETHHWFFMIMRKMLDPFLGPIKALGSSALASTAGKGESRMGPLRPDQWHEDVEKFNNMTLAGIQQAFVEVATGPSDSRMGAWLTGPSNEAERRWCQNQKVLSTAYSNFSVFALAMILGVGGLIIILSYILEPLVAWIQRRCNLDAYARLEWTMNDTLQLQRLAHEELGLGTWRRCDEAVPVTEGAERLGLIDLDDPTHPRLKAPPATLEKVLNKEAETGEKELSSETSVDVTHEEAR